MPPCGRAQLHATLCSWMCIKLPVLLIELLNSMTRWSAVPWAISLSFLQSKVALTLWLQNESLFFRNVKCVRGEKKRVLPPVFRNCGYECTYNDTITLLFSNRTVYICSSVTEYPTIPAMLSACGWTGDKRPCTHNVKNQLEPFQLTSLSDFLAEIGVALIFFLF